MKIFLIGLSGTGKTTIGKQLAKRLKVDFIDSDAAIEKNENRSIAEIFELHGELYFRELEKKFLNELLVLSSDDAIISTGGGMPCFGQNMDIMLSQGVVIHLTMPLDMLESRLQDSKKRPLLKHDLREKLQMQFNSRIQYYSKASLTVESASWNADKMNALIENLHQINAI